ncbi:MAG: S9 family peptidase [Acidobacteria bacterium]|nr:S9 family peptidase [Acidobacteriota bacterium]
MKSSSRWRALLFMLIVIVLLAPWRLSYARVAAASVNRFAADTKANGFTLEQVMSSPFPAELIASADGSKIAWVFDDEGRRNIWLADAPQFKGRALTHYIEDDGQEITGITFSPDANFIAYVRGGEANSDNEIPNPTSDPAGAKREILIVNTRNGNTTKIAEGSAPMFAPQGDKLIFTREGHLWAAAINEIPAKRLLKALTNDEKVKQMFAIRGEVASPVWSPDGAQLAFVSVRGDHSFIAIFDPKAATLRFLEPSVDRDIEPRWSADSKQLAYIRLFNVTDVFSRDNERITPWAIRVVDVANGKGREIWKSGKTELDSFARLPLGDNQLQWANHKIVFASEMDGWAHLYSVSVNGGEAVKLTAGNYEVENVAFASDRTYAIVATNADDIERRHLWKINLAGGKPEALTSGDGIEMYPLIVDGGQRIACLRATARDPFLPVIYNADGTNMKMVAPDALPTDFPASALVEPEPVIVKAADGMEVHCQLFKAKNAAGKTPALVFMHGGPMRQMLLGWHYNYYYHNSYAFNQYLARRGYTVIAVNYRAGIGYGRAFREAKHRGQRGASEYQDVVAAAQYLQTRSDVDARRIGLWGGSYGGFLTAMGLARNSDIFAAGVDLHGVHDWTARVGRSPWATGNNEALRIGKESSPISSVEQWKSPVLLIHGDDDRNVAFSQTIELTRKLRERGVDYELLIFPDEVHDFLRHESWLKAYQAAADFFDRKLK